jgi:dCMP deaminase
MRLSKRDYFISMLSLCSSRGTCVRRKVAAIITDRDGHVLSTSYNGPPKNFEHCTSENPCSGAFDRPGDTSNCLAIHAEANALLQCGDLNRAHTMYCSCLPCFQCAKLIANTNIESVICESDYADKRGLGVLLNAGCIVDVAGTIYGMDT